MRVGIFVLMAGREAGGPETYEVELIRALAAIDRDNEYVVYCTTPAAVDAIGVRQENVRYHVLAPKLRPVSVALTLPAILARDAVDFFHATFTPPPFFTRPLVFTMHCLSNFAHPEYYSPLTAWRLNRLMEIALRRAGRVLCVSRNVRDEVAARFGVSDDRLAVTYNGVGSHFVPTAPDEARDIVAHRWGIRDPYVLFVGKLQARKNIARLIRAYAAYRARTGSNAKLLLAGRRHATAEEIDTAIAELNLHEHVIQAGYFKPADLPVLYSGARMFVFPSLWEGFGIPVLEAMACGTPVITSTATSLPEVAGDAGLLVDPTSVDAIGDAMVRLEDDETLRRTLIGRGLDRARMFTWAACAQRTLSAYRQMGHQTS